MVDIKNLLFGREEFTNGKTKGRLRKIVISAVSASVLMIVLVFAYGLYSDRKAMTYVGDLGVENPVVQQNAIRKIAQAKDAAKITIRTSRIIYDDSDVRSLIIKKSAGLLQNQNSDTVLETLKMMGKIEDKSSVPFLVGFLKDKRPIDKDTAVGALEALGRIGDSQAVQAISGFLYSEDISVRLTSIWALGNIGDKKAVPLLNPLLSDMDKYIRYQASVALRKLG